MGQRRNLQGARILITGASQGIGRSLAVLAAKRGAKVLAAARSEELLRELADEVRKAGGTLETVTADVTSPEDRQKMVDAAQRSFGGLDVLINNAGIGATGHLAEAEPERLRKIFEVNFFGLAEITRLFIPVLKQGTKPAIVNISSIAARRGIPGRSEYSASKFAVQGLSEALRAELYKDGIDVLIVNPGLTQTNFSKNMLEQKAKFKLDHMRGMTSEQAAEATLRAIEKGKNEATLTLKGKLLVFFSRFFPRLVDFIVRKKVRQLFAEDIEARRQARQQPQPQPSQQVPV
jgi:short-subunit dehydrogenase